jgi:type IV fimbrial biogenesis protein FimT
VPKVSYRRFRAEGFSLAEVLVVVTIAGLLLGLGIPGLHEVHARSLAARHMLELRGLLELARSTAVLENADVTVCGTLDGTACSATWRRQPTLLFIDQNANRALDAGDRLLAFSRLTDSGAIDWRGSNGRRYVRFRPGGGVKEFGTFFYCPADNDARHARALVVSATGRPRATRDTDGDGIAEDAYGAPLQCPL